MTLHRLRPTGRFKHPGLRKRHLLRGGRRERGSRSLRVRIAKTYAATPATDAPGVMTEGARDLPRGGALGAVHSPSESGHARVLHARRSRPTSLVVKSFRVTRSLPQGGVGRREAKQRRAPSTYAAPRRKPVASPRGTGGRLERAGAVSKRDSTRKGRYGVSRGTPRTEAQNDVVFPGGSPARARPPTRTGRRSGAGKRQRARTLRFVPARRREVAESGIEGLLLTAQRKQSGELARGGQPERRRKTRAGSCSE